MPLVVNRPPSARLYSWNACQPSRKARKVWPPSWDVAACPKRAAERTRRACWCQEGPHGICWRMQMAIASRPMCVQRWWFCPAPSHVAPAGHNAAAEWPSPHYGALRSAEHVAEVGALGQHEMGECGPDKAETFGCWALAVVVCFVAELAFSTCTLTRHGLPSYL